MLNWKRSNKSIQNHPSIMALIDGLLLDCGNTRLYAEHSVDIFNSGRIPVRNLSFTNPCIMGGRWEGKGEGHC